MKHVFSLGIDQLHDELNSMQSGGVYWLNCALNTDALRCLPRLLQRNAAGQQSVCIDCRNDTGTTGLASEIANLDCLMYQLPEHKSALLTLPDDVMRALNIRHRMMVLLVPATLCQSLNDQELTLWLTQLQQQIQDCQATLLILCYGSGIHLIKQRLLPHHRALCGLTQLIEHHGRYEYGIAWWCNHLGVVAHHYLPIVFIDERWSIRLQEQKEQILKTRNDAHRYLVEKSILANTPALSENWQLFENNTLLAQAGAETRAATLVFALHQRSDVEKLAQTVYRLRQLGTPWLKIVVRSMNSELRAQDERLLLTCGASLVVPHSVTLSGLLTMLNALQGTQFTREIPQDIGRLFTSLLPLQQKGYLPHKLFCSSVLSLMESSTLGEQSKGILLAFKPVKSLKVEQSVSLFHSRRFGDIATIAEGQLYIFLYSCLISELDITLNHLFPLPLDQAFMRKKVWYQDVQVLTEIKRLSRIQSVVDVPYDQLISPKSAISPAIAPQDETKKISDISNDDSESMSEALLDKPQATPIVSLNESEPVKSEKRAPKGTNDHETR